MARQAGHGRSSLLLACSGRFAPPPGREIRARSGPLQRWPRYNVLETFSLNVSPSGGRVKTSASPAFDPFISGPAKAILAAPATRGCGLARPGVQPAGKLLGTSVPACCPSRDHQGIITPPIAGFALARVRFSGEGSRSRCAGSRVAAGVTQAGTQARRKVVAPLRYRVALQPWPADLHMLCAPSVRGLAKR